MTYFESEAYGPGCDTSELIRKDVDLEVAVTFEYESSMQQEVRNKRKVLLRNVDLLYLCVERNGHDDNMYGNEINVERIRESDENKTMVVSQTTR